MRRNLDEALGMARLAYEGLQNFEMLPAHLKFGYRILFQRLERGQQNPTEELNIVTRTMRKIATLTETSRPASAAMIIFCDDSRWEREGNRVNVDVHRTRWKPDRDSDERVWVDSVLGTRWAETPYCRQPFDGELENPYMYYYPSPPNNPDQVVVSFCGNQWPENSWDLIHDGDLSMPIDALTMHNLRGTFLSPELLSMFLNSNLFSDEMRGDSLDWPQVIQVRRQQQIRSRENYIFFAIQFLVDHMGLMLEPVPDGVLNGKVIWKPT
ncbi:hypothetical protein EJ05DRAFT_539446 [Pseudovirgaria hyperparasitica]|uniref:Uncharacterized protein n=1 Tax=Pseudovirgaria hyperparasitica TaxID=470096 RepID=A0A6A6W607_9PEZI|nr:uncharacterized protein EJ05DRAFT_539446 [Pseudovirgaria hyperparasitica]KAF2756491.1 hypothetical protein EJ05DRAFT_539446 [Pseudovirgaria hyperparasitica]